MWCENVYMFTPQTLKNAFLKLALWVKYFMKNSCDLKLYSKEHRLQRYKVIWNFIVQSILSAATNNKHGWHCGEMFILFPEHSFCFNMFQYIAQIDSNLLETYVTAALLSAKKFDPLWGKFRAILTTFENVRTSLLLLKMCKVFWRWVVCGQTVQ